MPQGYAETCASEEGDSRGERVQRTRTGKPAQQKGHRIQGSLVTVCGSDTPSEGASLSFGLHAGKPSRWANPNPNPNPNPNTSPSPNPSPNPNPSPALTIQDLCDEIVRARSLLEPPSHHKPGAEAEWAAKAVARLFQARL